MKTSHGRHGGNRGKTDRGEAANQRARASVNADTDRRQGHTSGRK